MSKGSVSQKNSNMATYLKQIGHRRTSGACPCCHKVVGLNSMYAHIASSCKTS